MSGIDEIRHEVDTSNATSERHDSNVAKFDGECTNKTSIKFDEAKVAKQKWDFVWPNVFFMLYVHIAGLYGLYLIFTAAKFATAIYVYALAYVSELGVTAGCHRLWSHRSYKARWPMRVILMILASIANQGSIKTWVRDHRAHHKFTETDADPYNPTRGFFFSHVGWLLVRKHRDVKEKHSCIDMSDIENDAVVSWQHKYFSIVGPVLSYVLPPLVPWYFWNETFWISWHCANMLRYAFTLNISWMINSVTHRWGTKSYDKNIGSTDNRVMFNVTIGEGWHNYHHVFPWDYNGAEFGTGKINLTTSFIDLFAWLGMAYDLKTPSPELIRKRALRTGDGTWMNHGKDTDTS